MTTIENSTETRSCDDEWTAEEVAEQGALDGVEDVNTVLEEQGHDVVIATLAPGHLGWDEGAINAGAATIAGVPEEQHEAYYAAYARAARERAEEIRDGSRRWILREADHDYDTIEADSVEEALEEARGNVDRSNYSDAEGTIWITVSVRCELTGEEASASVTLEPDEPECSHEDGHDWRSPYSLLGGLKENPGVWGNGGGVIIKEVCVRCGCERVTDTWAQDPETGEQGLTSVSYEEGAHTIDNELEAIRWDGDVGVWCDRWFVRGEDGGAFDSEEEARRAASWRIEAREPGSHYWSSDGLEASRGANRFDAEEDAAAAIDSLRELGDEWAAREYRAVRIGRER